MLAAAKHAAVYIVSEKLGFYREMYGHIYIYNLHFVGIGFLFMFLYILAMTKSL